MDILNKIKQVVKILDEIEDYYNSLPDRQSELDKKISDLYHYIETQKMTSKSSYRMIKELKSVLDERRILKQEHSILNVFDNNKARLNLKTNRAMLLADVNKENKLQNSTYKYRVYTEEELKNKMEE